MGSQAFGWEPSRSERPSRVEQEQRTMNPPRSFEKEAQELAYAMREDQWRVVARNLKAHLARTNRPQQGLAEAAGLAPSNLSAYLNLSRMPKPSTMARILAAALATQGVTRAMIEQWSRTEDETEAHLRKRLRELEERGVSFTEKEKSRLVSTLSADAALTSAFLKLADEVDSLTSRCSQLAMAHTDAARESIVQSAVEAFSLDPRMKHFPREVEKDIRRVHNEELRRNPVHVQALEGILAEEGIRIERVEPRSPRAGRGRWAGLRWLLNLRHSKKATITAHTHSQQYPFELGRVVGHLRMMKLFGGDGQDEVARFASEWVAKNFPQAASDEAERAQLEQDIIWLIFRSLAGRWATGFFTLPSDRFTRLAEVHEYDIDSLADALGVSWETIANRISQLDSGLPVHFIKMDWRGVVLKRSSFSGLRFAPLYMRVCGRWASARSLITVPGSIFRQYSVFPDLNDETFFCVGRSVRAPSLRFGSAPLVYSLTIGVRAEDAHRLIYARQFTNPPVEVGVTCRLCTVLNCENRVCPAASLPGMGKFDFRVVWSGRTIHERLPAEDGEAGQAASRRRPGPSDYMPGYPVYMPPPNDKKRT